MPRHVRNHQAVAPDGTTVRRSSQTRTYSHAVIGIRSIEADKAYANRLADMNGTASNFEWYKKKGDRESLMGATTVEEYREAVRARGMARIEERRAAGDYSRYVPVAWCGRLDLAQKELARHLKSPQYCNLVIVEAVIL